MYIMRNRLVEASRRTLALGVSLVALMAATLVAVSPAQASTTFTVINTKDSGAGTLRQAMFDANVTPGADVINFNIAGTGVKTITPTTALPKITEAVTINGYSQPGAHPNTKAIGSDAVLKIELSGGSAGAVDGLWITASNSTVKGLAINRWYRGIRIEGSASTGNRVVGNYLGTDASGTQDLGNTAAGVYLAGPDNVVGGATAGERNVISGNESVGVHVAYSSGNRIVGNYVGTDATGTKDLGNADVGVNVTRASSTIGGVTAGERNVISGNDIDGVYLVDASGNKVTGNYIGTDKNGTAPLGNTEDGVHISNAPDNVVGGMTAGERNLISGNHGVGVGIEGASATGNRILSNSIFANGLLGIDLGGDGTTANDPGDPDTGPNYLQNKPVLYSAKKNAAGTTTIRGTLDSTPGKTFKVQFFSNPKGTDEGKTLLGSTNVLTDGSGKASFAFSTKKEIRLGQNITATATGEYGTSEFSAPKKVVAR
jgi:parallel beta-helix repeat protein